MYVYEKEYLKRTGELFKMIASLSDSPSGKNVYILFASAIFIISLQWCANFYLNTWLSIEKTLLYNQTPYIAKLINSKHNNLKSARCLSNFTHNIQAVLFSFHHFLTSTCSTFSKPDIFERAVTCVHTCDCPRCRTLSCHRLTGTLTVRSFAFPCRNPPYNLL